MVDLCAPDATSLTAAIRRREVSTVEVTRASLARMDALEPTVIEDPICTKGRGPGEAITGMVVVAAVYAVADRARVAAAVAS